jgi:hypothetical protein
MDWLNGSLPWYVAGAAHRFDGTSIAIGWQ